MTLAVGKAVPAVDFGADDGEPCTLIVLLASPADVTGPHIQALARISRLWLLESFRRAVAEATTAEELRAAIESHQE